MANDDGFLSRWSRRKADVREGRPLEASQPAPRDATGGEGSLASPAPTLLERTDRVAGAASAQESAKPAPTLEEAQQLTPESDFTGFMARGVAPDVKNAAMKKLFADPHFNVMDRLDIYIDDYTQPDPLPLAMLRQMTSAKTLNLFDDASEKSTTPNVGDNPTIEEPKVVAQSAAPENLSNTEPSPHDHADLRLQPDPSSGPQGTEPKPV